METGLRVGVDPRGAVEGTRVIRRSLDDVTRGARSATGELGRKQTMMERLKRTAFSLQGVLGGLSAAMVLRRSIRESMEYETSMSRIVGLVGVARDQVQGWRRDLLALGPAVGKGPGELANAMFFVTSAGARGAEALDIVTQAARAATAGLGDTAVVADAVTSAINAYGSANLDAGRATGILVAAVREGKAEASSIADAMGRILPIASELGVSFDQVAASVAAMTRLGLNAAESVTSLRGVLSAMLRPTKDAEKAMDDMGLSSAGVREILRRDGLLGALEMLSEKFEENEDAMTRVFPNVRALTGVLNLMGSNAENVRDIFASLANATEDDLNKAFEAATETAGFKMQQALSQISALLIQLGDTIMPAVAASMTTIVNHSDKITSALRSGLIIAGTYFALFKAAPAIYAAAVASKNLVAVAIGRVQLQYILGTRAATRFTAAVVASNTAMWGTSVAATAAAGALGKLALAGGALMAAFTGVMIGKWLHDNFEWAQVAGLEMVRVLLVAWEELKFAFRATSAIIVDVFTSPLRTIRAALAGLIDLIVRAIEMLPARVQERFGLDGMSDGLRSASQWLHTAGDGAGDLAHRLRTLRGETDSAIAAINDQVTAQQWQVQGLAEVDDVTVSVTRNTRANTAATTASTRATAMSAEELKKLHERLQDLQETLSPALRLHREYAAGQLLLQQAFEQGLISTQEELDAWNDKLTMSYRNSLHEIQNISEQSDVFAESWRRAIERVDDMFVDLWKSAFGGASNFVDGLKNVFKQLAAENLHASITRPMMQSIFGGMPGFGGAGGAAEIVQGKMTTAVVQGAGGSGGMMGGALSGLGLGNLLGGLSTFGSSLGLGATSGLSTMLGLGGSAGGLLGGGLGGLFGGIGSTISGSLGMMTGGGMAGFATGLGGLASAVALPIAALAFGGIGIDKLLGGRLRGTNFKTRDQGINLSVVDGVLSGESFQRQTRQRSFFRGSRERTLTDELENVEQMQGVLDSTNDLLRAAAQAVGVSAIAVDTFTTTRSINTRGMDEDQVSEAITKWLNDVSIDAIRNFVTRTEGISERFRRVVMSFANDLDEMTEALSLMGQIESLFGQTPGAMAQRMFDDANRTATERYQLHTDGLRELISQHDGSLESLRRLTAAYQENRSMAAQLALDLMNVSRQVRGMFGSTAQSIRESVMTDEELYSHRQSLLNELVAQLDTLTDPGQIAAAAQRANDLVNSMWSQLDDIEREQLSGGFINFLDQLADIVERQSQIGINQLDTESAEVDFETSAALIAESAETFVQAADTMLEAAHIFRHTVDDFSRGLGGYEVGGRVNP
jgi:TP901 family phage tail tape measure protein